MGTCAGTAQNLPGDRSHKEQTVANSKERRPSQGTKIGSLREYTLSAVKNAVAAELVREITLAALRAEH